MQVLKQLSASSSLRIGFGFSVFALTAVVLLAASCAGSPAASVQGVDGTHIGHWRKLSDFPLYELRYEAAYNVESPATASLPQKELPIACTLFSATDATGNRVMGRNFDWAIPHSVLVVITKPEGGYASISLVDMAYLLGMFEAAAKPFDGMNERGLAVGLMKIDEALSPCELGMHSVNSLAFIRVLLDNAATVDDAIALARNHYITFGPNPLHYFIADRSGASATIEFYRGELRVYCNKQPWQVSANFVFSNSPEYAWPDQCWRYALADKRLSETNGRLDSTGVFGLLKAVSVPSTVWSSSYNLTHTRLTLALGRNYARTYSWNLADEVAPHNRWQ